MNWYDFNTADDQQEYEVIPKGTLVKVRMNIKPGGYNDENRGWTGGYATRNGLTGAVYLNVEFVVLEGQYARRKIWSLIGLHSDKGVEWANMGRSLIKGMINSARGLSSKDLSPLAQNARCLKGLGDLDGLEFVARADTEKDQHGNDRNIIRYAVTCDHKDYAAIMRGGVTSYSTHVTQPAHTPVGNVPAWAK